MDFEAAAVFKSRDIENGSLATGNRRKSPRATGVLYAFSPSGLPRTKREPSGPSLRPTIPGSAQRARLRESTPANARHTASCPRLVASSVASPASLRSSFLTLAVGIGATTAAVNVAASVLLTPLPVKDDSRLVLITKTLPIGSTLVPFSHGRTIAMGPGEPDHGGVAGVQYDGAWPWSAEFGDRALTVTGTAVSGNFFSVLGAQPIVGRLLAAEDAVAGTEQSSSSVMASGAASSARTPALSPGIRLDGRPATIVGVAPPGFAFPKVPTLAAFGGHRLTLLNEGWFTLVARLKPSATFAQAGEESAALLEGFGQSRALGRRTSPRGRRLSQGGDRRRRPACDGPLCRRCDPSVRRGLPERDESAAHSGYGTRTGDLSVRRSARRGGVSSDN